MFQQLNDQQYWLYFYHSANLGPIKYNIHGVKSTVFRQNIILYNA